MTKQYWIPQTRNANETPKATVIAATKAPAPVREVFAAHDGSFGQAIGHDLFVASTSVAGG
jgi:hypothetical protein